MLIAGVTIQSCRQVDDLQTDELPGNEQQLSKTVQSSDTLFVKAVKSNDSSSVLSNQLDDSIPDLEKKHPPVKDGQDW